MPSQKVSARDIAHRFFPAVSWLGELKNRSTLRADLIAGITVAMVLIPQSMAYAQLAGLPPYYGLYAAFLPPMVAALFGSSRQLQTGPVAVVSLMTAASLEPIATAGGDAFIAYAILLALMVGLFQLALGLLRLGVLVNFLSHPVVLGFTNAAAIIIATSQLSKIFGVSVEKAEHHYETVWNTLVAAAHGTHWPTLGIAVLAFVIMIGVRRISPRLPNVLIAVAITTLIAWGTNFEKVREVEPKQIGSPSARELVLDQLRLKDEIASLDQQLTTAKKRHTDTIAESGPDDAQTLEALHAVDLLKLKLERRIKSAKSDLRELKTVRFEYVPGSDASPGRLFLRGEKPEDVKTDGNTWRVTQIQDDGTIELQAGGSVVGTIPEGLPAFKVPRFDLDVIAQLMLSAIAISLIGFMEAISIAKAMAVRTRQRLDPNQELVGQGLGNIVGSMFQSYSVSGSFSRSAVNIDAGAITGFSSVVTSLVVIVTLMVFTPLLYHLPQATLAAVIMMAVIGLVNVNAFKRIWQVEWHDGVVAVTTFVLTLAFAPHLDVSILVGVVLSLGIFLSRSMRPRVAVLSRHPDGSLRDAEIYGLETCPNITVIRFDGSLYFANTSYFEDKILEKIVLKPELKYVIVDGEGINHIDATGEEMLIELTERLHHSGIKVLFTRMKKQVMDVLQHSGFVARAGPEHFFRRTEFALDYAWMELGNHHEAECPLNVALPAAKSE